MTTKERVDAHDRQIEGLANRIEALTTLAERQAESIKALALVAEQGIAETQALRTSVANLTGQWQAYINTLPKH
jgi:hypothetical protein